MIDRSLLRERAEQIGVSLDGEALERFDIYAEMLTEKNKVMNLTAITEPKEIVEKHFCDSLALLNFADFRPGGRLIDVGTGAGFPGVCLLIAENGLEVTLLDSTNKRLDFIREVLEKLGLEAEVLHGRAEEVGRNPAYREKYDFATARAVTNLRSLAEYCLPFVKKGGLFLPMKSGDVEDETAQAQGALKALGGSLKAIRRYEIPGAGKRTVIEIKKTANTPKEYPRPKGKMDKKPL